MGKLRKVPANFAQVSWEVARDRRITPSLESLGAHALIQATPDDFDVSIEWLAAQKSNGYRAAKKAVDELITAGLYHRVRVREGRLWRTYVVCPAVPCSWEEAVAESGLTGEMSPVPDQLPRRNLQVVPGSAVVGTPQAGTPAAGTPAHGDPADAEANRESREREWEEEASPPPPGRRGESLDRVRDAEALLADLPEPWLLGPVSVGSLAPLVAAHLAAGWPPRKLLERLTGNPGGVRDPERVLAKRLRNVPAPPKARGRRPVCVEHLLEEPCRSCAADRRAAGGRR